ncbi:transposase, MuDR, MULE transposase domain protein [Tanacetum coccineum]
MMKSKLWLKNKSRRIKLASGSSFQTREICDVYLTEKELHQLHRDEEALREIVKEEARDEKEREEKIRQQQAGDEEYYLEFRVDGAVMSTQEYIKKVVEDVDDDEDFKSGSWVSATDYVHATGGIVTGCLGDIKNFLKNRKLEQVVAIVKSCSPNVIGDLTVTMKDLLGTIPGTIHHKVIGDRGYEKDITVGAAMILANVLFFTSKPSKHYLNITMRNLVKVFRKDTVPGSGSVSG